MSNPNNSEKPQLPYPVRQPLHSRGALVRGGVLLTAALIAGGVADSKISRADHTNAAQRAELAADAQLLATQRAHEISVGLTDNTDYPDGVPVAGVLNGTVSIISEHDGGTPPTTFINPILLATADPTVSPDTAGQFLDQGWVGIPEYDGHGHTGILPVQLKLGQTGNTTVSVHFNNPDRLLLTGASVYMSTAAANQPGQVFAFDPTGDVGYSGVPIQTTNAK